MGAKVLPINPDAFPRIVASATIQVGEREVRVARLDEVEGYGPAVVFVGQPIDDLMCGPDDEIYLMSHVEAVDDDGQVVSTFLADECFEQMVSQAGRIPAQHRPKEVFLNSESRAIVHGLLNMLVGRAVS
jgi:hypothetical protein